MVAMNSKPCFANHIAKLHVVLCIGLPHSFLCLLCLFVANSFAFSFPPFAPFDGFSGGGFLRFPDRLLRGLHFLCFFHRPLGGLFHHFFLRGFLWPSGGFFPGGFRRLRALGRRDD